MRLRLFFASQVVQSPLASLCPGAFTACFLFSTLSGLVTLLLGPSACRVVEQSRPPSGGLGWGWSVSPRKRRSNSIRTLVASP